MARGTDFGGIHSSHDLHLIQQKVEVDPAEPKLNLIEIPGADGAVDLSEIPAGRVTYKTRKITWVFALYPGEDWDAKHRQVNNALNGRRCNITLDTDPGYYYQGRLSVSKHNVDGLLRQITVVAICQPYKLRQLQTQVFVPFSGKNLLDIGYLENPGNFYQNTAVYISVPIVLKPYTTYTFSCDSIAQPKTQIVLNIGTDVWVTTSIQNVLKNIFNLRTGRTNRTAVSFTTEGGSLYYLQYYMNGANLTTWTIDEWLTRMCANMQLEEGPTATAYESFIAEPEKEVILLNDRKTVVPTITCSGETTIATDAGSYVLDAGTHKILDFQLEEGETRVTLRGTGAASIVYQEGSL